MPISFDAAQSLIATSMTPGFPATYQPKNTSGPIAQLIYDVVASRSGNSKLILRSCHICSQRVHSILTRRGSSSFSR
jgi:hypothetical protein